MPTRPSITTHGFDPEAVLCSLQFLRQQLLVGKSSARSNPLQIERYAEPMDNIQAIGQREQAAVTAEMIGRRLRQIDEAMERVRAGEWGICIECEEQIGPKRLLADPAAELCVRCKEKEESKITLAGTGECAVGHNGGPRTGKQIVRQPAVTQRRNGHQERAVPPSTEGQLPALKRRNGRVSNSVGTDGSGDFAAGCQAGFASGNGNGERGL